MEIYDTLQEFDKHAKNKKDWQYKKNYFKMMKYRTHQPKTLDFKKTR